MKGIEPPRVDVAINMYGKPYNTAVTILSLLERSSQHIDKIYLTMECVQPNPKDSELALQLLDTVKERIIVYVPKYHIWYGKLETRRYVIQDYRHSIRYQYAFESTDKPFLLITHNDVMYRKDVVEVFLENIAGSVGVGSIGQCWNCPAGKAGRCASDRYNEYRPSLSEIAELVSQFPLVRYPRARALGIAGKLRQILPMVVGNTPIVFDVENPWPLPECRLNEFSCLVDIGVVRPISIPNGPIVPIGSDEWLDTGVRWFHMLCKRGHRFRHVDIGQYCEHAWAGPRGAGHPSLFSQQKYQMEEEDARKYFEENYS